MSEIHKASQRPREIAVVSPKGGDAARAADQLSAAIATNAGFHMNRVRGLRSLKKAIAAADLVWLHDTLFAGGLAAFWFARRQGKPLLVTRHRGPVRANPKRGKFFTALFDRVTSAIMLKNARQATFTNDAVAEHYYQRLPFAAPVKIIPNGVELDVFRPASMERRRHLRHRFALRDTTPVLLFVGDFTEANGLLVIHHLAQFLHEWHFWLAGTGPIDPEAWFLPNVHVFKKRSREELAELYQSADRLILPGTTANFPLAIQEAMACGLPAMTSPIIASCNYIAKPHLLTAPVEEGAPQRTALLWAEALQKQQPLLPLKHPKAELADLAHIFWQWPKIAGYYTDMLRGLK
jgi:glycosyltransferase involved in cell wall biosynthesis